MAAISSAADGTWIAGAATTWVGGVAPTEGDTVTILNTHDVEIDGNITVGADTTTAAIVVNNGGRLFVPSTVAGSYTLICKGDLKTDGTGGTIEIGTVANPIPVGTTFTIKLNYSATLSDGEFGLLINAGGTFTCQGTDPWASGLTDPDRCLLAADAAVNATALTVDGAIDWNANDYIAIAPTGTVYSQYENGQVDSVAGTTLNVKSFGGAGGGLAYAHTGTDPDVRAEIINLTRNVVIMNYDGVIGTPGAVSYVSFATTAVVDVDWTEFRYMGENASGKYGIVISTTTGSCNLNRCSFHHFEDNGIYINGTTANNFTLQNLVCYKMTSSTIGWGLEISHLSTSSWALNNIWMIGCSGEYGIRIYSALGTISNIMVTGTGFYGMGFEFLVYAYGCNTVSNIKAHSCNHVGIFTDAKGTTMENITAWHNTNYGLVINGVDLTFNNPVLYGNTESNVAIWPRMSYNVEVNGLISSGTTTRSTSYGIYGAGQYQGIGANVRFNNPVLSYVAGVRVAHSYDIFIRNGIAEFFVSNPSFNATTANVAFLTGPPRNMIHIMDYDQTAGDHRTYIAHDAGEFIVTGSIIQTNTAYYHTAAPSCKMTPTSAIYKLESGVMQIPVASGANPTVSVYLRKSAAYNGAQPRLICKRNDSVGIVTDVVMATFAGAVDVDTPPGTFTQLSGQPGAASADGVIEVYVDCDGTAGYINICDWAVTGAKTQADNLDAFWFWGVPFDGLLSAPSGGVGYPPNPLLYGRG